MLADDDDDFDLLDAHIDPYDFNSLKKRDELLKRIDQEKLKISFKHLKHRFKVEGVDWLLAMDDQVETELETLISVPGAFADANKDPKKSATAK